MTNTKAGLRVAVYSDVICPWCYIGKTRLDEAIKLIDDAVDISVEWKPYQLNAAMPVEGMDRDKYMISKFGTADVSAVQQQLSKAGSEHGIRINFSQIKRIPNTMKAHRLLWFAKKHNKQEVLLDSLFRRFFYNGQDLGSTDVLVAAAAEAGLPSDEALQFLRTDQSISEVQAEEEAGVDMGIHMVPTFVVDDKIVAAGAESANELAALLKKAASKKRSPAISYQL